MEISKKNNYREQLSKVWKLSIPAILTQIATIVMQYIDSAMVGRLGEDASASIGLVTTTTWLLSGLLTAASMGFAVQIAHSFGANDISSGRKILRHGLIFSLLFSVLIMIIGVVVTNPLPIWLGAEEKIWKDASIYFFVFCVTIPFQQLSSLTASSLQCGGNMVIPSVLNALMCLLDVVFNAIFIPKYQVLGAAIGTALAGIITSLIMFYLCCFKNEKLNLRIKDNTKYDGKIIKKAIKIGFPIAFDQIARSGAMIVTTRIIAPLGSVSIASNSFADTAESLCYMPAYGISSAATTLVGQEMGAGNNKKAKSYGNMSIIFGVSVMTIMTILMFIFCPFVFMVLTPVKDVRVLSAKVLRIGLLAEPLYGLSVIATGALRGAEDTLVPSILNLLSIWLIRISLCLLFVLHFDLGLVGVWMANAIELSIRGIILLIRHCTSKFYFKKIEKNT